MIYILEINSVLEMFPELKKIVIDAGMDKIRKYCPSKVHIVWQQRKWQIC
jgi:hypothetical protein